MLISIIIPVYNVSEYLEKCVKSIFLSDISNCEIILVDDGSSDGKSDILCDKIAKEHPQVVRVIHQQNKGLGGARNTGIDAAKGEYLFFIDSDDWLEPKAIDILKDAVEKFHSDIISFNMRTDDGCGNGKITQMNYVEKESAFDLEMEPEYMLSLPNAWNRLWKKSLFVEYKIKFPERVWYEDIRTTSKLFAIAQSIATIKDVLYVYYQRDGSIMKSNNINRNKEIIEAFDDIITWFTENDLYEKYKEILCSLCIQHLYIAASVRVIRMDDKNELIREFAQYMQMKFPEYRKNPLVRNLTIAQRLVFCLLEMKQYKLIKFLFAIKDK